jgi:hypothetical protein
MLPGTAEQNVGIRSPQLRWGQRKELLVVYTSVVVAAVNIFCQVKKLLLLVYRR